MVSGKRSRSLLPFRSGKARDRISSAHRSAKVPSPSPPSGCSASSGLSPSFRARWQGSPSPDSWVSMSS
ncbi:unnamed protein product, partial [Citrullus colocynthis]